MDNVLLDVYDALETARIRPAGGFGHPPQCHSADPGIGFAKPKSTQSGTVSAAEPVSTKALGDAQFCWVVSRKRSAVRSQCTQAQDRAPDQSPWRLQD